MQNSWVRPLETACYAVITLLLLVLVGYDLYQLRDKLKKLTNATLVGKITWVLTSITIMLCAVLGINATITTGGDFCKTELYFFNVIVFTVSKVLMKIIFVLRLRIGFGSSQFAYSDKLLGALLVGIVGYSSVGYTQTFLDITYDEKTCTSNALASPWVAVVISAGTLILLILVGMFVRPLLLIVRELEEDDKKAPFVHLARKYCILGCVAIMSRLAAFVMMAMYGFLPVGAIDALVLAYSLVLFSKQSDWLYYMTCCCLAKKLPEDEDDDEQAREHSIVVGINQTKPVTGQDSTS